MFIENNKFYFIVELLEKSTENLIDEALSADMLAVFSQVADNLEKVNLTLPSPKGTGILLSKT